MSVTSEKKNRRYCLLTYCENCGPINDYKFKAEVNPTHYLFKEYEEKGLFSENDFRIIVDKTNKEQIIKEFEKFATENQFCFYKMRKSLYKILLYEDCLNDNEKGINIIKKNILLTNYHFIDNVVELFENPKVEKKVKQKCYDLIYELLSDASYISKMKNEFEPKETNPKDKNGLLKQFIDILVGKYNSNKQFILNEFFKSPLNENVLKHLANQLIYMNDFPREKAIELYLLSLEKNIKFIEEFIEQEKYTKEYETIKKNYEIEGIKGEKDILQDLFAKKIFMKGDINKKYNYFRYPIWLIIKLYYTKKEVKSICEEYFVKFENNAISKDNKNKHESSLLNIKEPLLEEHISKEITKYFELTKKPKMITFKYTLNDKDSLKELIDELQGLNKEIKIEDTKNFSNLIQELLGEKMKQKLLAKDFYKDITTNETMSTKLNETIKNECKNIITSLYNKEILKHDNKIEQSVRTDFFKNKTLKIDPVEETLPEKLIKLIKNSKINEKHFPSFLNEIKVDTDLILRMVLLKESFLNNNYMKKILAIIIEQKKENKNIQSIIKINKYINEYIIELHLLYKINEYASAIDHHNDQNDQSKVNQINIDTNNLFQEELKKIISTISSYKEIKRNHFKHLIKYSKELCKRMNYLNEDLLNIELQYITTENKDLIENSDLLQNIINSITQKHKIDDNILKDRSINFTQKQKKFLLDLLEIYYYKSISNEKDINSIKSIMNILSSNIELSMDGSSLYQQIIGDLISINNIKVNKGMFISRGKEDSNILFEIDFNSTEVLEKLLNFVKMDIRNEKYKKIIPKINNSQYMLIQSIEKHLLKVISKRNAPILKDEMVTNYFENALEIIKKCNENMLHPSVAAKEDKKEWFKQFIAIAFMKIYFQTYLDILYEEINTSHCLWASSQLSEDNEYSEVIKILKFYVLKLIRNRYCKSFTDFRNINFIQKEILWVSDLIFKGEYQTEFEYLFISEWEDSKRDEEGNINQTNTSNFFNIYQSFLDESFDLLKKESFRTTKYDSSIKNLIENNNIEIYIDVIMNIILCNTWNTEYIMTMEYVEFCSWSKHFISSLSFQHEELVSYLYLLSVYSEGSYKYCFSKILDSLKQHNKEISILDVEIILISLKFVLAFIIKTIDLNNISELFNRKNSKEIENDNYYDLLCNDLINFLAHSIKFYIDLRGNAQCRELIDEYNKIRRLLHLNNINQIKLFMNFLYYRIKTNISNNGVNLNIIIEQAVTDWPLQQSFIQKYYDYVKYKKEKIRNLLLEERMTPEATDGSKCNINKTTDSPLQIPVFTFFFYEELPTWDHFKKTNESNIQKNREKYPYIHFFLDSNKYDYYEKELTVEEIQEILKNETNYKPEDKYYPFKYSGFISLNDLAAYHSKSYVFAPKNTPNCNLGDLIEYDIDAIENELSSIKHFVVKQGISEQNKNKHN